MDEPLNTVHEFVSHRSLPHLEAPLHPFKVEQWVLPKMWKKQEAEQQLEEQRKGPYDVLTTHASKMEWSKTVGTSHQSEKRLTSQACVQPVSGSREADVLHFGKLQVFGKRNGSSVLFVLYLFPQIDSHTDSFSNSNCWI